MPIIAKLEILMDDRSQVTVTGPIENRLLVYGMLDVAKDAIREHNAQKAPGRIEMSDEERAAIAKFALKL